jgi:hypothetical protein
MLIGMLHNRKDPNKVSRAYLYSAIAKLEGADFFYFTTKGVDFQERYIKGMYYDKGRWKRKLFPFPDVVINAANQKTRKQNEVYYELEKMIPYTSYPVGSKVYVYKKLAKSKSLSKYLIPYMEVNDIKDIIGFLRKYKEVIIKPIRGHHGDNVIKVEELKDVYRITEKNNIITLSFKELLDYFNNLPKNILVQKYINSTLKSGEPFDFRLHLQKNKDANWEITIIIPRVGIRNYVITNLSQGSQMIEFIKFLKNEYLSEYMEIKEKIKVFALTFATNFEALYPYFFDELGIDIGFDKDKNIWVYEVNWRPGHVFIEVATAKNAIQYAMYLGKKRRKENEKNLPE